MEGNLCFSQTHIFNMQVEKAGGNHMFSYDFWKTSKISATYRSASFPQILYEAQALSQNPPVLFTVITKTLFPTKSKICQNKAGAISVRLITLFANNYHGGNYVYSLHCTFMSGFDNYRRVDIFSTASDMVNVKKNQILKSWPEILAVASMFSKISGLSGKKIVFLLEVSIFHLKNWIPLFIKSENYVQKVWCFFRKIHIFGFYEKHATTFVRDVFVQYQHTLRKIHPKVSKYRFYDALKKRYWECTEISKVKITSIQCLLSNETIKNGLQILMVNGVFWFLRN